MAYALNEVTLMGYLTADPEESGNNKTTVAKFTVAINEKYGDKDEAQFIPCVAFNKIAEAIIEHFHKGKPIYIRGSINVSNWEDKKSGETRWKTEVRVGSFKFLGDKEGGGGGGRSSDDQDNNRGYRRGGGGYKGGYRKGGGGYNRGGYRGKEGGGDRQRDYISPEHRSANQVEDYDYDYDFPNDDAPY